MRPKKILLFLLFLFSIFTINCSEIDIISFYHEPLTIVSMFPNMELFIDKVHEKYPEINFEIIPYRGNNMTAYLNAQLASNDMPDIYVTTNYVKGQKDLSNSLLDLSGYAFTSNFSPSLLHEVSDNGATYLLPTHFSCLGITYNKTLLEKNGWTLPTSFDELSLLAPKVKEAGCELALNQIALPGYGFQYLCNILDTGYFNTISGRQWQKDFLDGKVKLSDSSEMLEALSVIKKWKEVGMLNGNGSWTNDVVTKKKVAEGNTLFMLGGTNDFTNEDTSDVYSIMPYLSQDGTKNSLILKVSWFVGLNKQLENNPVKLEDALHVMEVLSTVEGMSLLNTSYSNSMLLPLKDYKIPNTSYYKDVEEDLNKGLIAPFIYNGWENIIVPIGNVVLDYIRDLATFDDIIKTIDENQYLLTDNSSACYTKAIEKINNDDCIRLIGECFSKASGADFALISRNEFHSVDGMTYMNSDGVSGELYPLPITDQEITSIIPTGWHKNIQLLTLTGDRIKEIANDGYDFNKFGIYYPYDIVAPKEFAIQDDKLYTIVICGVTTEVAREGNIKDTGILGLDAAREYFKKFETFTKKEIEWEKVK